MKRVGIIASGGDCPGLNRVIDSVVRGLDDEYEIFGFIKGFKELLDNNENYLIQNIDKILKNPTVKNLIHLIKKV